MPQALVRASFASLLQNQSLSEAAAPPSFLAGTCHSFLWSTLNCLCRCLQLFEFVLLFGTVCSCISASPFIAGVQPYFFGIAFLPTQTFSTCSCFEFRQRLYISKSLFCSIQVCQDSSAMIIIISKFYIKCLSWNSMYQSLFVGVCVFFHGRTL